MSPVFKPKIWWLVEWLVLVFKICSFYGLWVYLRDTCLNSSRIAPQREWDYPGFSKDSPLAKWSVRALFARCKKKKEAQKFRPRQNSRLTFPLWSIWMATGLPVRSDKNMMSSAVSLPSISSWRRKFWLSHITTCQDTVVQMHLRIIQIMPTDMHVIRRTLNFQWLTSRSVPLSQSLSHLF